MNERKHLAQADRHIAKGERLIERTRRLMAKAEQDGHPTAAARELLLQMEQSVALMNQHRAMILSRLKRTDVD